MTPWLCVCSAGGFYSIDKHAPLGIVFFALVLLIAAATDTNLP